VHLVEEDQAPLYLANTPYFLESDYMTREDLLLQKQMELEAALKRQQALIAQLMNKQPNP